MRAVYLFTVFAQISRLTRDTVAQCAEIVADLLSDDRKTCNGRISLIVLHSCGISARSVSDDRRSLVVSLRRFGRSASKRLVDV